MSPAEGIEPKRSEEYTKLLEELRNIETTLDGIVKERRLRGIRSEIKDKIRKDYPLGGRFRNEVISRSWPDWMTRPLKELKGKNKRERSSTWSGLQWRR